MTWAWRLYAVIATFVVVMAIRGLVLGIGVRDPGHQYLVSRPLTAFGLAILYVLVWTAWRTLREDGGYLQHLRAWATRPRVVLSVLGLLGYQITYLAYRQLKSMVVFHKPCGGTVCDKDLERIDTFLWFGHHPAQVLHDVIGVGWQTHVMVFFYEAFSTLVLLIVPAYVLAPKIRDAWVGWATLCFAWIGGTISYYLLPTLGPFAVAPGDFAGLPQTVVRTTQATYVEQRYYLLAHPHASDAVAQIGAFASLHVGISCSLWLVFRYYRLKWPARLMGLFTLITCFTTVYLGWHFFVDVPAGALIAFCSMWLAKRVVYRRGVVETEPDTGVEVAHSAA